MTTSLNYGAVLHGYRIERELGRGGMGIVYLARQLSLNRQVALKVLNPAQMRRPGAAEGFFREAGSAARLSHPNLVAVHDLVNDPANQVYAYSMEYVPGSTAAELIKLHRRIAWRDAMHLVRQAAAALGHAHRAGLVHRDVKPANLLVTSDGTAKLLDLGLASGRHPSGGLAIDAERGPSTNAGRRLLLVGTLDYVAPEQARNPARAIPASDVWSLGATLHHLLAGSPPFTGESLIDLVVRAATEPAAPIEDVPPPITDLIAACMDKQASRRPADGQAALELIDRTLAEVQPPPSPGRPTGLHPAVLRRRHRDQR